jgi:hypothetical protein
MSRPDAKTLFEQAPNVIHNTDSMRTVYNVDLAALRAAKDTGITAQNIYTVQLEISFHPKNAEQFKMTFYVEVMDEGKAPEFKLIPRVGFRADEGELKSIIELSAYKLAEKIPTQVTIRAVNQLPTGRVSKFPWQFTMKKNGEDMSGVNTLKDSLLEKYFIQCQNYGQFVSPPTTATLKSYCPNGNCEAYKTFVSHSGLPKCTGQCDIYAFFANSQSMMLPVHAQGSVLCGGGNKDGGGSLLIFLAIATIAVLAIRGFWKGAASSEVVEKNLEARADTREENDDTAERAPQYARSDFEADEYESRRGDGAEMVEMRPAHSRYVPPAL